MINIITSTTYYFPVGIASDNTSFKLSLYSDLSKHTTEFNVDANTSVSTDNYFPIIITQALIDMMPGGEYNYFLYADDVQVSKGLLRITKDDDGEYDPAEDYVVYGVENEWITTNIEDGSALWQSGYTSGYTDGRNSVPLTTIEITQNGVYLAPDGGYNEVSVNVSGTPSPTGTIEILENGEYNISNYAVADVHIPVESYYQSGYTSGHTDGYNEGVEDGFQEGYGSGYTDGVNSVPLTTTAFTDNGIFTASTGGWSAVTIDVPTGITPTGSISLSANGEYDVTLKASAIVDVPTQDYYQSGYTDGRASISITSKELNINQNGTHIVCASPDSGWSAVTINVRVGKFDMPLAFMAGNNEATVEMTTYGNCRPNLEYSLDEENWNTWDYSTITLGAGEYVYFRGVNSRIGSSTYDYAKFSTTGTIYVGGNIMSILDGMAATTSTTINQSYCFYKLFAGSTVNLDANLPLKLPATTLAANCYDSMFMGCTSLIGEITLPAKSLPSGCYTSMFKDCTSFSNTASTINLYATSRNVTSLIDWLNNTSSSFLNSGKVMNYGNVALQSADVSGWATYKMQTYTPS